MLSQFSKDLFSFSQKIHYLTSCRIWLQNFFSFSARESSQIGRIQSRFLLHCHFYRPRTKYEGRYSFHRCRSHFGGGIPPSGQWGTPIWLTWGVPHPVDGGYPCLANEGYPIWPTGGVPLGYPIRTGWGYPTGT